MAADPTVAERAYGEIKRRLLDGDFHLRQRLDAQALAAELGASTTPVREALVRLYAERLIAARRAHGYYVALWSEQQLACLYAWRADLAELASESAARSPGPSHDSERGYPERVRALLQAAAAGGNPEHIAAALNADDRLHHARRAEAELWPDVDEELARLARALEDADAGRRRAALRAFHQRRIAQVRDVRERALILALPANGT